MKVKFLIQSDNAYRMRSVRYISYIHVTYKNINAAIKKMKQYRVCVRLCMVHEKGHTTTVMLKPGIGISQYTESKQKTLMEITPGIFIPKTLVRKTTQKRKRKCKQSKNSTKTNISVKSTVQDSSFR